METLIETIGYLIKKEHLSSVKNYNYSNSSVFENSKPFPGYYGNNIPSESHNTSFFLLTSKLYSFEEIAKVSRKVKDIFKYDFNASPGKISFKISKYNCIRIKYLKNINLLSQLQALYFEEGIKFLKNKNIDSNGTIKIHKSFYIKEIENGLYIDLEEESKCYFELPELLLLKDFSLITKNIKNNLDNNQFDAALGLFYRNKGIVYIVRIYDKHKETDRIKSIKKMYLDEIKKL
ncbi:MAG: hypothetical protein U9R54_01160 [Bacteroidota bacterium]|nr:hypothetical protein [Bacteroidota bacterium]